MKRIWLEILLLVSFSTVAVASSTEVVDAYLNKAAKNGYSGSILLEVDGKIILKKGYGFADQEKHIPFQVDTAFDIGSLTKQFTGAAILKLESQKKLSVNDPITKYFRDVPEDKKGITIHHLLTHTAGLTDALGEDEEYIDRENYIKKALGSPLIHPPGSYDYSNVGFSLLAAIVEKVSGKNYEQFLVENFFRSTGMMHTGYVMPQWKPEELAIGYRNGHRWGTTIEQSKYKEKGVTWHLKGNGGIFSTVEDMRRWAEALRTNQVLPAAETEKLFHPHVREGENAPSFYGYGWAIQKNARGENVITHNGGNGFYMATVTMLPERKALIVISSTNAPKNTDVMAERIDRIVFENLKPLEESWIAENTGVYKLPSGTQFRVEFNENDEAVTYLNNSESYLLISGSKSDDPQKAEEMNRKTTEFFEAVQKNTKLADEDLAPVRLGIQQNLGPLKNFEVIGSVSRRNGEYYLTAVKLTSEKGEFYRLFIWKNGKFFELRALPLGNTKEFQYKSENQFYSETNDVKIEFAEPEGKHAIIIHARDKDITAVKVS